jgi:hypothetical protein
MRRERESPVMPPPGRLYLHFREVAAVSGFSVRAIRRLVDSRILKSTCLNATAKHKDRRIFIQDLHDHFRQQRRLIEQAID